MTVPKEAVAMALDEMILKGYFPDAVKTLDMIAKRKKITIYEVMENILKDMEVNTFEDLSEEIDPRF